MVSVLAPLRITGSTPYIDVTAPPYNATGDGSTDDTTAIQAAITAAAAVGGEVFFPPGEYVVAGNLTYTVPTGVTSFFLRGVGAARGNQKASRIRHTKTDGTDLLTIATSATGFPNMVIEGLTLIGPDPAGHASAQSGWGIKFNATGTTHVRMYNVHIQQFYGASGGGMLLDNVLDSVFAAVAVDSCSYGVRLQNGSNANIWNGCQFRQCSTVGLHVIKGSQGEDTNVFNACTVESNEKTGLSVEQGSGFVFNGCHFENNNTTSTAGEYAIKMVATTNNAIQAMHFDNSWLSTANDRIYIEGAASWLARDIRFIGGYAGSATSPIVQLVGTNTQDCLIEQFVALSQVSDTGLYNTVRYHSTIYGGPAAAITTITAAYTVLTSDELILASNAGGGYNITLPAASSVPGRRFTIRKTDATTNFVSVVVSGGGTIDGFTGWPLWTQHQSVTVRSTGSVYVAEAASNFLPRGIRSSTSTPYTITATDDVILIDASGGAKTVALPAASTVKGREIIVKKIDSSGNAVTIDPNGSETVDGAATLALSSQYSAAQLVSDGTNWHRAPRDVTANTVTIADIDGTPSVAASTLQFPNGSVTDQGGGVARYTPSEVDLVTPYATVVASQTPYAVTTADRSLFFDATSGPIAAMLPTAVGIGGRRFACKKVDASTNVVTIRPPSGQTIDGETSIELVDRYAAAEIVSNNTDYYLKGRVGEPSFAPDVAAVRAVRYGLVSAWAMNETSGTRNDSYGTNHLADNATVTTTTAKVGTLAAQFTLANSEFLSISSNASLQTGDVDFWVAAWVKFDTLSGTYRMIAAKDNNTAGTREWALYWYSVPNRFQFDVNKATDTPVSCPATAFGAPATGTWYFAMAYHDAVNDLAKISINGSAFEQVAVGASMQAASSAQFRVGARQFTGAQGYHDGAIDAVYFGKSPSGGIAALAVEIRDYLYNSGTGREYPGGWT